MRRVLVVACCAAFTVLGGVQASAQVLPPPGYPRAEPVGVDHLVDVWGGLRALTAQGW